MITLDNNTKKIADTDWNADFNNSPGEFKFQYKDLTLNSMGVELGALSESFGISKKLRFHESKFKNAGQVESQINLPFGSEPSVSKTVDFVNNYAKITTNIEIKGAFPLKKISFGKIIVNAEWEKYAIIDLNSSNIKNINWKKMDNDFQLYSSDKPFLILLLETKDGTRLEIGTGDDIWRWMNANQKNATSSFSVSKKGNSIEIIRDAYIWDEEISLISQNLHFRWYFSWCNIEELENSNSEDLEIKLLPKLHKKKFRWDSFAKCAWKCEKLDTEQNSAVLNEEYLSYPCMSSSIMKHFKKIIRSMKNQVDNDTIVFTGIYPSLCDNASHVERKKKKILLHWNINKLLDFYLWANKQLIDKDSQFFITPEKKSIYNELPSFYAMRKDFLHNSQKE